ncbi:hypothetical protein D3C73_700780 [compost metagenome]
MSKIFRQERPSLNPNGKVKRITKLNEKIMSRLKRKRKPKQILFNFTVLWVNNNGDPFNTSGFTATARTLDGVLLDSANFDAFGTVVFNNISTPTQQSIRIQTFNANGVLFRTRVAAPGNSSWVIIG